MFLTKCVRPHRLLNLRKQVAHRKINFLDTGLPAATATVLNRRSHHVTPYNWCYRRDLGTNSVECEQRFEKACEETLQSLTEYFEELVEDAAHLEAADVSYSGGVLTVSFGPPHGTYVINRQGPNRQIWLSSPTSGPKRYDFVPDDGGYWLYRHDGKTLHKLLQEEVPKIINSERVDFRRCSYGRL